MKKNMPSTKCEIQMRKGWDDGKAENYDPPSKLVCAGIRKTGMRLESREVQGRERDAYEKGYNEGYCARPEDKNPYRA